jgi:flavodoxin
MAKALVVYSTRTGETQKIGELIAEGIRMAGHEATLASDKEIKKTADL